MKDCPNLDLLRSIAVLLVIVSHLLLPLGWQNSSALLLVGRMGVTIFFVHTCLVLMLSMDRHGASPWPFYVRRFFRIYPLSVVMVALVALGGFAGGTWDFGEVASNLLLIQNITGHDSKPFPLWSLPYEVQMYLVLPALYVVARSAGGLRKVALLWLSGVAAVGALWLLSVDFRLIEWVPCFLSGVLAYVLQRRVAPRFGPMALFTVLAVGIAIALAVHAAGVSHTPILWVLSLVVGLVLPWSRQIESRPLAAIGKTIAKYSYGMYLTHIFAIGLPFYVLPPMPVVLQLIIFAAVLAAFSRVAYRWVEAPGIALGVRLSGKSPQAGISVPTV